MKNYRIYKKSNYFDNQDSPVILKNYTIFSKLEEKFLVLNLVNKQKDLLKSMDIEIKEFDKNNEVIKSSLYEFKELNILAEKHFLPFSKIKLANETNKIEFKLVDANYENEKSFNNKLIDENIEEVAFSDDIISSIKVKSGKYPLYFTILLLIIILVITFFNYQYYLS